MSEASTSPSRTRWGWRCAGHDCAARERAPLATEVEAAKPASEHRRATGHLVSWGILVDGKLR